MSTSRVVWLHTNRRAFGVALIALLALLVLAVGGALLLPFAWMRWTAAGFATVLALLAGLCGWLMSQPRLSYAAGQLYVRLRGGAPIQVPIEVVECFFLGQGPALLPRRIGDGGKTEETSTVVVRLAESAEAWKHLHVQPLLGLWCDGYITIRGTWCEPITNDLMHRLNQNLIAAHREVRGAATPNSATPSAAASPTREQEVG